MAFLFKYWRFIVPVTVGVALIVLLALWGQSKYNDGREKARQECQQKIQETINENLKIRQDQDAVARPDTDRYIDILQRGQL